jgi:hypothetical protein
MSQQQPTFYIGNQDEAEKAERNKVLSIFCYELKTLLSIYIEKHNTEDNFVEVIKIATSESMLIHIRNLIEFLYTKHSFPDSTYSPRNTDYIAESLINQSEWRTLFNNIKNQKPPTWEKNLTKQKNEISKRTSHITHERVIGPSANSRNYYEYIDCIIDIIISFLENVADVDFNESRFLEAKKLAKCYRSLSNKII